ncbi:MAG: 3-hydroxybutyryl-CoA dehydrogenase [Deltaproteobacteria bacterium RIFCSPLOWO2_02_FULL_44_10]|nr:MAG: 3-hydroxybutyryl-CoA dehydrogenase [Deltaproteobacteria bacterium RIFCSPHIGHO2_02_FULL_44_16]OGQ46385.1 MAG: 3-hydroxybutyryl-CoA dehydrogenase [Deltaproteobacteria bacterium RIFCSPLOWO2_02_FULL_44_10]
MTKGILMTTLKTIGVIGAGQMGSGIAQVFATAGFHVVLQDTNAKQCAEAKKGIEKSLTKFVEKGKLAADQKENILARLTTTTELQGMKQADVVIEAVTENLNLKLQIFSQLDHIAPLHAILASNTSSISITSLAAATHRPDKVIGMHFMNPVPLMKGVEVIHGQQTSAETAKVIASLIQKLGKTHVSSKDVAGFVANRILMPMIREAIETLEQGVASRDDIDRCMIDCCNFPMGPLALADLIGLDTCASILHVMADGLGNDKYRPTKLMQKMIAEGKLGRKTGEGFYNY